MTTPVPEDDCFGILLALDPDRFLLSIFWLMLLIILKTGSGWDTLYLGAGGLLLLFSKCSFCDMAKM